MEYYTKEFLTAWKAYGNTPNASKSLAFQKWQKLGKNRPEQALLLAEINCYNQWLSEQSSKNGREYPKCHMATWLSQRRYEGFEDQARAALAAVPDGHSKADLSASAKTWEGAPLAALMALLGGSDGDTPREAIFEAWFAPVVMIRSMPMELRSPSKFHRDYLENKFGNVIRRALGPDVQLTIAGKEKTPQEG